MITFMITLPPYCLAVLRFLLKIGGHKMVLTKMKNLKVLKSHLLI